MHSLETTYFPNALLHVVGQEELTVNKVSMLQVKLQQSLTPQNESTDQDLPSVRKKLSMSQPQAMQDFAN